MSFALELPQQLPESVDPAVQERAERDGEMVRQLRAGNEAVFRQLVAGYTPRLYPFIRGVVRDNNEAEDVLQIVFWKIWKRIDSFRGESSLSTWIYRIAMNAALDWRKHRKVDKAQCFEDPTDLGIAAEGRTPAETASSRDLSAKVREAMLQLPEKFRTALMLREIEGLTYEEIARDMNIAIGTVESRIFRARAKLAKLLKASGIQ